ncbi:virulence RhuM family protein [Methanobrevibacter sp. OttesenSCG-928-K11]|nr:virulence RhuM family protein [Methanobrevibacter sp. OttesenSCG-928-K11]MDL2271361.1 virulence RhuM family protein [Methanobrevibacter sp. OttesenSCG-928-I08]
MSSENEVFEKLLFQNNDEDVLYSGETFWATEKAIATSFGVKTSTINYHLKNIFKEGELDESSAIQKIEVSGSDGKKHIKNFYNLDTIISVGYKLNSSQATNFRIWATNILKEYLIKGFVLDDELLKKGRKFGKDYFDELIERVREIRISNRRAYQKIADLYELSYDYNDDPKITGIFYSNVQNKIIYAVTGETAPEIIKHRADSEKLDMGLTRWKGSPNSKIHPSDIIISKNYLTKEELKATDRLIDGFLETAEIKVENTREKESPILLKSWTNLLDGYLKLNDFKILTDKGDVSKKAADTIARKEYKKYRELQDEIYKSDNDKRLEEVQNAIRRLESKK